MATIGDSLRLDSDGIFRSSGSGPTMRDESRGQQEETFGDRLFSLVDPSGRLCGYFTYGQIIEMPERSDVGTLSASLTEGIELARRTELLRSSLNNKGLSTRQRTRIRNEIGHIRQHPNDASTPVTRGKIPDGTCYIARDRTGTYLGAYSRDEVSSMWPSSRKHGYVIYVHAYVSSAKLARLLANHSVRPIAGATKTVLQSARLASIRSIRAVKHGANPRCDPHSPLLKNVIYVDGTVLCSVPVETLEDVFGSDWFYVDDSSVQLVSRVNKEKAIELGESARKKFISTQQSASPGKNNSSSSSSNRHLHDGGETIAQQASDTARPPLSPDKASSVDDASIYIVRDSKGLFAGLSTLTQSRERWGDEAVVDRGLITIPTSLSMEDALKAARGTPKGYINQLDMTLRKPAKKALAYMSEVKDASSESLFESQNGRRLQVRTLDMIIAGAATTTQLQKLFGNGWFTINENLVERSIIKRTYVLKRRIGPSHSDRARYLGHVSSWASSPGGSMPHFHLCGTGSALTSLR